MAVPNGRWQGLRRVIVGNRLQGFLDGQPVVEATDAIFKAGQVGFWTKADSRTASTTWRLTCLNDSGRHRGWLGSAVTPVARRRRGGTGMFSNQRIAIAAIIAGLLAAAALAAWPWARREGRFAVAGLASALGLAAWNTTLNLTNGTGFNVDAPLVRVSWQDAGSGVLAFAVTALALGLIVARSEPARRVIGAAALAGLVVLVFDIFGF